MNKTYITVAVLVLVVAGGLSLILKSKRLEAPTVVSGGDTTAKVGYDVKKVEGTKVDSTTDVSASMPVPIDTTSTAEMQVTKEFTVKGANYSFAPSVITVKKGDKVKITFENTAGFHNFVIDEFGVASQSTKSPTTEVLEFTANQVGSFQYYCSVGSHRAMGMFGTLIVTK